MNIEHMQEVRDFIAELPDEACGMRSWHRVAKRSGVIHRAWQTVKEKASQFITFKEMKEVGFKCGTVGCIAGWTAMMAEEATPWEYASDIDHESVDGTIGGGVEIRAQRYLGLTAEEAVMLFRGYPSAGPAFNGLGSPRGEGGEGGWKAWMLRRLDVAIATEKIEPWEIAMKRKIDHER